MPAYEVPEQSGDIVWAELPASETAPAPRSGHTFTMVLSTREVAFSPGAN